jgi:hypothetical protein
VALGLSSPLPCPQTARPSSCKGARAARELATNPCSATGASGSHLRSFASHAKLDKAGGNRKCGRKAGTINGPNNPDVCTRFPFSKNWVRFPRYRERRGSDRNSPLALGGQSEIRDGAAKNCMPTMPQADRRSRFLALIWAMRTGPSENSPSPAFRVNSRK